MSTARPEHLLELALELGFDLAGLAPLAPPPDRKRFEAWLDAGHHGSLAYLDRQRARIADPRRIAPGAKSLLVVGLGHARPAGELEGGGRIARYALGRDYHNLIGKRLRKLARRLAETGLATPARSIVDAGPLLERSHAQAAGLGFASKAANLLHPRFGPWFFLGELLLQEEFEPTPEQLPHGSCGTCTACLDACPTGAIVEPGRVDAPTCISYQTIEQRRALPEELRAPLGDWVFGCDICSEVCPWGKDAPSAAASFGNHAGLDAPLTSLLELQAGEDQQQRNARFASRFEGSPLRRPGRVGLARNAAIVLGNRPSEEGCRALLRALEGDPSPLVREVAGWSLARAHADDAGVLERLGQAARRDPDETVRTALERHGRGSSSARSS